MMVNARYPNMWFMRGLYLLLCLVLIFINLLPLSTTPKNWVGPDLILALTFAWVLRRPDFAPLLLIAFVFLLADFLLMRPPGLWSCLVLIGSQFLRYRVSQFREQHFIAEWGAIVIVLILMHMIYHFAHIIFLMPEISVSLSMIELVLTVVFYPLIVGVSHSVLRVQRLGYGSIDAYADPR